MDSSNYDKVDNVNIKISMDIIEHFSKNLYRTSNKALEELVTNGYDAIANNVYIYLPGEYVTDKVMVWDDGNSMDITGLKSLWHIAASPKASTERVVRTRGGDRRQVIGKFGIGKLASYTLGSEISHLCKKDNKYHLISINYDDLQNDLPSEKKSDEKEKSEGYQQSIFELKEHEALAFLKNVFNENIEFNEEMFDKESWTCAIIDKLKPNLKLSRGTIRNVLARSMPLKPDFNVYFENIKLESKLLVENSLLNIEFSDPEFKKRILSSWKVYAEKNLVEDEIIFSEDNSEITFPNLGLTRGSIRVSHISLLGGTNEKIDRLYGFFVYVKDRLINPEDDRMYLKDPSFSTFYRSQFIMHCDGLDNVLLADRERISNGDVLEEFKILQKTCYQYAASIWNAQTKLVEEARSFKTRLPVHRKELFADPISYLWSKEMRQREDYSGKLDFDLEDPNVELRDLGTTDNISKFDFEGNKPTLVVNDEHPFFRKLKGICRNNKVGKQMLQEFENTIAMESMFGGYLSYLEIDSASIDTILHWRDSMYRQLAIGDNNSIEGAVEEMKRLSFSGDRGFEEAVSNVLNLIGFKSKVMGFAGNPDILAEAYLGKDTYRLTFETKGSGKGISNAVACVAAAPSHAKKVEAEHAVIIARKFNGFEKKDYPAILEECGTINRAEQELVNSPDIHKGNIAKFIKEKSEHPTVSIMTVDNLAALAYAVYQYRYDLNSLKSIFTTLENPDDKELRINKLEAPEKGFDMKNLIEFIYQHQYKRENRPFARINEIYDDHYADGDNGVVNLDEFEHKIEALLYLAFPYVNKNDDTIVITSTPDVVVSHLIN